MNNKLTSLLIKANRFRHVNEYDKALNIYLQAYEMWHECADLCVMIALCYYMKRASEDDYLQAVSWMNKAILMDPDNSHWHALLGEIYYIGLVEPVKSAAECRRAISMNPNDVEALMQAAALEGLPEEVVSLEESIGWVETAAKSDPKDPNPCCRLGDLYRKAGRDVDAKSAYMKAFLRETPLDPTEGYVKSIESYLIDQA